MLQVAVVVLTIRPLLSQRGRGGACARQPVACMSAMIKFGMSSLGPRCVGQLAPSRPRFNPEASAMPLPSGSRARCPHD